jgi:hypothetical protein
LFPKKRSFLTPVLAVDLLRYMDAVKAERRRVNDFVRDELGVSDSCVFRDMDIPGPD